MGPLRTNKKVLASASSNGKDIYSKNKFKAQDKTPEKHDEGLADA